MVEEERKYAVDPRFDLPDLTDCLPAGGQVETRPAVMLRASYYDTADLALARAGVSLRHRSGDEKPGWTVKLPTGSPGARHEIDRPGPAGRVPPELAALVTVYARGAPLHPAVTIRTKRIRHDLRDAGGRVLAEVADDTVEVLADRRVRGTFREIEVERKEGRRRLLRAVGRVLEASGANEGDFTPKHVRALGTAAASPPDLVAAGEPPGRLAMAADVVMYALRTDAARMLDHDPLVRLRANLPNGDTAVHQMRVGIRRLRTDLRTFGPLLGAWATPLRAELTWIAEVLGGARDGEVLRARLRRTAAADPSCPLDPGSVDLIDTALLIRHDVALDLLADAMDSIRYRRLVDSLVSVAAGPGLTRAARDPAAEVLPRLVAREWHRLADGSRGIPGAGFLADNGDDTEWHEVRKRTKRARYAAEVAAFAVGAPAADLALVLAAASDTLGTHQDAAVAAERWLGIAEADPSDHRLAVTAGRLYERERAAVRAARHAFPKLWADADREEITAWLR